MADKATDRKRERERECGCFCIGIHRVIQLTNECTSVGEGEEDDAFLSGAFVCVLLSDKSGGIGRGGGIHDAASSGKQN